MLNFLYDCNDFVTNNDKIVDIIRFVYNAIKIGVPIILVVVGMFDMGKAITQQKEDEIKKAQTLLVKKAVAALIVFLMFAFVQLIVSLAADDKDTTINCINSILNGKVTDQNENNQNLTSDQTAVTFTRNGDFDYQFQLPEGTEKFTFRVEYNEKSWAQMKVNGKVYKQFQSKIYHNTDASEPDVVELEFNVSDFNKLVLRNGYSMGQKYYINNQEIPLTENDMSTGATNFQLTLEK